MIYLDNAATSFPKPEAVYQALDAFARQSLANPGRAGHKMALAAERALDDCRHLLNVLFNGAGPERFVFTLNCTDALNMAFKGILQEGDHVVTTNLEHNSVSRPLRKLELDGRITLTRIKADGGGTIDPDDVRRALIPKTRLVAVTHTSNVLGTVQPIAEIGALVRERGPLFLVDAAQTAGVVPIDVRALPIDLLAFPGHKSLMGPTGTGALYVGPRVELRAWREGGTGGDSSSETQPRELPYFLEGGTPNVLGVAGLAAGIKWVQETGIDSVRVRGVRTSRSGPARWNTQFPQRGATGRGDWRDSRSGIRHRHPSRFTLRALHSPRAWYAS
jgi:cysteine desulfurase / selenocysteine lyase